MKALARSIFAVIVMCIGVSRAATVSSVSSGNWSNPAVWGGAVPTTGDTVQIIGGYGITNTGTGSVASQIRVGTTGGNGNLRINSGSISCGNFYAGYASGTTGTVSQSGGTVTVSPGKATQIGGVLTSAPNARATFNISSGTFNGETTSIGMYGRGIVNLSGSGAFKTTSLYIGDRAGATGIVSITGGELNTGNVILGRYPNTYGELGITNGIIQSTGYWNIGTNGTGRLKITGTGASILLSNTVTFGSNAIYNATLTSNGITTIKAGVNKNIQLGGTLVLSAPGGVDSLPVSTVLFQTQGSGVITGAFDRVNWNGLTDLDLVYTSMQILLNRRIIKVSDELLQPMTFGIDAERLWHWTPIWSNELAQAAVVDIAADYVRVAINCAYEREEGVKNPTAYTNQILPMMQSMKAANPAIKFFASPRPLQEAYTAAERDSLWGGAVPWSPYPAWILQFQATGTDTNGNTIWSPIYLDVAKLAQYLADYLNLMHSYGIDIDYLDMVNENGFVTSAHLAYVATNISPKLDAGVQMPQLIAPSSWSLTGGAAWVNGSPSTFFDVAAAHNTGGDQSLDAMEQFSMAALSRNVDAWNSELHNWIGPELTNEIITSEIVWNTCRAGFSSFETWLFFGDYVGKRAHPMCLVGNSTQGLRTNGKYSIFKKLVNETGNGNYLEANEPLGLKTAAFKRNNTVTVWVLNSQTNTVTVDIKIPGNVSGSVEVSRWHGGLNTNLVVNADVSILNPGSTNKFSGTFLEQSLYCLKMSLQ